MCVCVWGWQCEKSEQKPHKKEKSWTLIDVSVCGGETKKVFSTSSAPGSNLLLRHPSQRRRTEQSQCESVCLIHLSNPTVFALMSNNTTELSSGRSHWFWKLPCHVSPLKSILSLTVIKQRNETVDSESCTVPLAITKRLTCEVTSSEVLTHKHYSSICRFTVTNVFQAFHSFRSLVKQLTSRGCGCTVIVRAHLEEKLCRLEENMLEYLHTETSMAL